MQNFNEVLDKQEVYFNTDATKTYEWRIEQLNRMQWMLKENALSREAAVCKDFKTASQEKVFEVLAPLGTIEFTKSQLSDWMKPVSAPVPKALAASGHASKPNIVADTRLYIRDFDRIAADTQTAEELYNQMLALYPNRVNPGALWSSPRGPCLW